MKNILKKGFSLLLIIIFIGLFSSCSYTKKENKNKNKNQVNNIENKNKKNNKIKKDLSDDILALNEKGSLKEKSEKLLFSEKQEDKIKGIFLLSYLGKYDKALNIREKLCNEGKGEDFCKKLELKVKINGVKDNNGNNLEGVKISIDGKQNEKLKGNEKDLVLYNNFVHRVKFSKKGYGDFYETIFFGENNSFYINITPELVKSNKIVKIDNNKQNIEKTDNFIFTIKSNTFVKQNGEEVKGNIDLVLFDIDTSFGEINYLKLPVLTKDGKIIGNSMITYGMPLIKAYLGEEELKINKDIIGRFKLENDGIMDFKNVPKGKYLSPIELEKYKIIPFWRLDQKAGIWYESKLKVLDKNGNIEFKLR